MLKLVKFPEVTEGRDEVYNTYFSHSTLTRERIQRYDPDRRCYYLDTMEEAMCARDELKAHFQVETETGKWHKPIPLYDVISEMLPWYDVDFARKTIQSYADKEKPAAEALVIPNDFENIEGLLSYLEAQHAGDDDKDEGPRGEDAIHLAECGLGTLRRVQNGTTIPINIEEAREIAKEDPDSIVLVFDVPF